MQELVQRTWSERSRLHIGDLAWERTSMLGREDTWRTALWEDDGQVVAWGWIELSEHLSLVVDPARRPVRHLCCLRQALGCDRGEDRDRDEEQAAADREPVEAEVGEDRAGGDAGDRGERAHGEVGETLR
ncbi:hypothetical protein EV652_105273 [Kribbella steppae]|uniref:Uncharacterized protein n=1 Tax=Kribbella steppae TaxID=2512223 RepID=A0A4R2HJS6_9ACTN|nr:hypothetical protein EV652_105273 [Kribbella steppae]